MLTCCLAIAALSQVETPRLDIVVTTSPFAAHYAMLRAGTVRASDVDERYEPGINLLKTIPKTLLDAQKKPVPATQILDPLVLRCTSIEELRAMLSAAPTATAFVDVKGQAGNYLRTVLHAMQATEEAHQAVWPGQYDTLRVQVETSKRDAEGLKSAVPWASHQLGLPPLPSRVEAVLVPALGWTDGVASYDGKVLRVAIVTAEYADRDLAEVIVREVLLAWHRANGEAPFIKKLREGALAQGYGPSDANQLSRAVFYALAGDAVRKHIADDHIDVGQASGLYNGNMGRFVEAIRSAMPAMEKTPDQAVTTILELIKA